MRGIVGGPAVTVEKAPAPDSASFHVGELQDFTNENVVKFGDKTVIGRSGSRELMSD